MAKYLCVDLDGTLLKVDTLHESLVSLTKKNPLLLIPACFSLLKGKAALKDYLAKKVQLDFSNAPFNPEVLEYIRINKGKYDQVHLVTGSHEKNAERVLKKFPDLFDKHSGTTRAHNLTGKTKARFLSETLGHFDYIGDSSVDFHVWSKANKAVCVETSSKLSKRLEKSHNNFEVLKIKKRGVLSALTSAVRPHQWAKNLLVFVGLVLSHKYLDLKLFQDCILAFFAFSFTASSVYLLNDLSDLDSDRAHRKKRFRPIPAGDLSPVHAFSFAIVLLGSASYFASFLPMEFMGILLTYFLITTLYSFRLKAISILDVVCLGLLFTIRLLAGHFAIGIAVSPWLLSFSIFIFISLACLKRSAELRGKLPAKEVIHGRGYSVDDYSIINQIGVSTGMMATLVMALYLNSEAVVALYSNPLYLWIICPLLIYWIGRMWLLGSRGLVNEDPVVFVVKDKVSLIIGALCLCLIVLAR